MNKQTFIQILLVAITSYSQLHSAPVELVDELAVKIERLDERTHLVDFGKVTFGNLRIKSDKDQQQNITIHFGEAFQNGRINRTPPGTVRYQKTTLQINDHHSHMATPTANRRNTNVSVNAVLTPKEWGVVLPFRWVEIEGWKGELKPENIIRQSAYLSAWNDKSSSFESSDDMLNQVWKLCKDSIKATTFAGIYVDGDRERIPYEADAYLNQLSHYYLDQDIEMARDSYDYLMKYPTWPTEWASHMIFMAHAEWMHTGDKAWIAKKYPELKSKLFLNKLNDDGLIVSTAQDISRNDIVDWPKQERDGYIFTSFNTVTNAFHIRSLYMLSELAYALGEKSDGARWLKQADQSKKSFNQAFYSSKLKGYTDGASTEHQSIHANLFPLALGLVPDEYRQDVTELLKQRNMDCSVYAAQYLLEALYQNGADQKAIDLITAKSDRSWRHMVESGATITWEAWDMKYKPNQDWNHAWGAAPANILPRFILGVEAATAGWQKVNIKPSTNGLTYAKGKVPTPNGSINVSWENKDTFEITISSTKKIPYELSLPLAKHPVSSSSGVYRGNEKLNFERVGQRWVGEGTLSDPITLTVR